MKKHMRSSDNMYHIKGKTFRELVGSRAQVWHKNAYKTEGNLLKDDLMKNSSGKIVSKKKHFTAKRDNRLVKLGFGTVKGKFGMVRLNGRRKSSRKSAKRSSRKSSRKSAKRGSKRRGTRKTRGGISPTSCLVNGRYVPC